MKYGLLIYTVMLFQILFLVSLGKLTVFSELCLIVWLLDCGCCECVFCKSFNLMRTPLWTILTLIN